MIDIVVSDRIPVSISAKLKQIGTDAGFAEKSIDRLNAALSKAVGNPYAALVSSANAAASAIARVSAAQTQATVSAAQASIATDRAAITTAKLATEQQRQAQATANAAAADARAQLSASKVATEQARMAKETSNAAAASARAERASIQLAAAQDRAAASALKKANAATAAATALAKEASAADKAAAANKKNSNAQALSSGLGKVGAAVGTAVGTAEIIKMADAYTTLQNKLQTVTTSQGQVEVLTEKLFGLANRTRMSIEDTTSAFTRFDRALQDMGKSQEDTIRMTESINKMLLISGATTQEASSSLVQLSQSFNQGYINGEEFNNVATNMPILLDAIAKEMTKVSKTGTVTRGELKKLGSEGKITTKIMYDAIKSVEGNTDAMIGKMKRTNAQGMTELRNNAIKFIGEFDKATGFTDKLSRGIQFLAENMRVLVLGVTVLGAAMLVAFGPAMIARVVAFSVALAANPIGLIVIGLTAAIAAFTLFGDKITWGTDKVTTLKDVAVAAFEVIGDLFKDMASYTAGMWTDYAAEAQAANQSVSDSVKDATGSWTDSYSDFYSTSKTGMAAFVQGVAKTIDALMGFVVGVVVFAGRLIGSALDGIANGFKKTINFIGGMLDSFMNFGIGAMNAMSKFVGGPEMQMSKFKPLAIEEGKSMGELWDQSMADGFGSQGAFQKMLGKIEDKAAASAKARTPAGEVALRGKGKDNTKAPEDKKAKNTAEDRAKAMGAVNLKLDDEIARLQQLQPLREQEQKFDQIKEQFAQKNIKISDTEAVAIKAKIAAIAEGTKVQGEMDRMYTEITGPMETYNSSLSAAELLLKKGVITREQYNHQLARSKEVYENAIDPLREEMQALKDQSTLLGYLPKQREIEAKMQAVINANKTAAIKLTDTQLAQYRQELELLQKKNELDAEQNTLLENSVYARQKQMTQIQAIAAMKANPNSGFTAGDAAGATEGMLTGMGLETTNLQLSIDNKLAMYQNQYSVLAEMRQADLLNEQEYAVLKAQVWEKEYRVKTATSERFFSTLAGLQNSNVKELSMIGKAAAISQAIINTHVGVTKAWAEGGLMGAFGAAVVLAQGMAQVAAIRSQGYYNGGYTGNGPRSAEAGVVHGQEYVFTAAQTARIGVDNLEAMANGSKRLQQNNSSAGSTGASAIAQSVAAATPAQTSVSKPANVTVINSLDPKMVGDYLATPEGEDVLINTIRKNGDIIKSSIGGD